LVCLGRWDSENRTSTGVKMTVESVRMLSNWSWLA